ncbi:MAG TPA: DUF4432 domain-containing protein [Clostridiales bacterium]|nr:DUF4432 domain-containing protein [Clostridiales bacterium]
MDEVKMNLLPEYFCDRENLLIQFGPLTAAAFRYPSGVCALRVRNSCGELIILPFQGQQIWRASFGGHDLTMKTAFDQPLPTQDYLRTYGGFLLHCGATAMGVPGAGDSHPLHGELPNLPYEKAMIQCGANERGRYLTVGGMTEYLIGFTVHYRAEPAIRLYENATCAEISLKITNLRTQPMEFMYLCHINFRPVDEARLIYSAHADPEHVKIHADVPLNLPLEAQARLRAYMAALAENPEIHHRVNTATQIYDPEIVMAIRYEADADGNAHCLQLLPDGSAHYVSFRTEQLPLGLRWISRTGDEDAMGMVLPCTAEHKGLTQARKNGQIRWIPAGGSVSLNLKAGWLEPAEAARMAEVIQGVIG